MFCRSSFGTVSFLGILTRTPSKSLPKPSKPEIQLFHWKAQPYTSLPHPIFSLCKLSFWSLLSHAQMQYTQYNDEPYVQTILNASTWVDRSYIEPVFKGDSSPDESDSFNFEPPAFVSCMPSNKTMDAIVSQSCHVCHIHPLFEKIQQMHNKNWFVRSHHKYKSMRVPSMHVFGTM